MIRKAHPLLLLFFITAAPFARLNGKQGCLTDRIGTTVVSVRPVVCYCPCNRKQAARRNQCVGCGHYHGRSKIDLITANLSPVTP